jgi:hypothetical protein
MRISFFLFVLVMSKVLSCVKLKRGNLDLCSGSSVSSGQLKQATLYREPTHIEPGGSKAQAVLARSNTVRIPLKAWMSVCVHSVFVLSCVQIAALRRADPPSKESYRLCIGLRN